MQRETTTMATVSPLVSMTATALVAAVSTVMTAPTKTWQQQQKNIYSQKHATINQAATQKQSIQHLIKCQLENIQQSIMLKLKTRALNNQQTKRCLVHSTHEPTNGVTNW